MQPFQLIAKPYHFKHLNPVMENLSLQQLRRVAECFYRYQRQQPNIVTLTNRVVMISEGRDLDQPARNEREENPPLLSRNLPLDSAVIRARAFNNILMASPGPNEIETTQSLSIPRRSNQGRKPPKRIKRKTKSKSRGKSPWKMERLFEGPITVKISIPTKTRK